MIEVKSSKSWIIFWSSIPLSVVCFLVYITISAEEMDVRAIIFFAAITVIIIAAYASNYVEFVCNEQNIIIKKPYSIIPFSRYNKLNLVDIKSVSFWTVKGKSFNFIGHNESDAFIFRTLWSVSFMGIYNKDLQIIADYLHSRSIETSGF